MNSLVSLLNNSTIILVAGEVLSEAIRLAVSISESDVATQIQGNQFDSFFGPIAFDQFGRNIMKPMLGVQITETSTIQIIAPASQGDDPVYPIPGSMAGNIFPLTQCADISVNGGNFRVCVESDVSDCFFETRTTVNGQELLSRSDRLDTFTAGSINETCVSFGLCDFCTRNLCFFFFLHFKCHDIDLRRFWNILNICFCHQRIQPIGSH